MENPAGYSCVRRFCVQQLSKNTGRKISLRLVIVTGMSGAGKTTALKTLEDMGFYCADNLPVLLIEKFAELVMNGQSEKQDIALGVDVRSGEELPYLETIIRKWRENKYPFSILFLDSSDEVLIKRFKETRRSHPLSRTGREFFMAEEENPKWLTDYAGFDSRQMAKMAHLEHMEDGTFVLFDYKKRDPLSGNAGAVRFVYKDGEETWQMK